MPSVYIIGDDTPAPVKIGFTTRDPSDRLADLLTGTPRALRVLASCEGDQAEEALLHAACRASHVAREWFARTPEIDALIRDPSAVLAEIRREAARAAEEAARRQHEASLLLANAAPTLFGAPPARRWIDLVDARRRDLGMTQADLADRCHPAARLAQSRISDWIRGVRCPSVLQAEAVHDALGLEGAALAHARALLIEEARAPLDAEAAASEAAA